MPPIPAAQMTPDQRAAAEEVASGRRGALIGPFIPAVRSPEFMRRLQRLGEYLRYDNALPRKLSEMAILLTARTWMQEFEWHVHAPIARQAGLSEQTIDAIAAGRRPPGMMAEEAVVHAFFEELQTSRTVGDATYGRALAAFGEAGVIDLVGIIGYYSTLAMIMNVARTPAPEGAPRAFSEGTTHRGEMD
jgi:4-carboxymuconolactone decarboxylase